MLLRASIYQEAVPVEALSWIIGDESEPSPPVSEALAKLINWGLIAKQETEKETFYIMHTLVREFAGRELEKEKLDRKKLLIRAAQYYENIANTTKNIWYILKAREYYYQAKEWEKANDIVQSSCSYLMRWGYIELVINLLNQSIETTSGIVKAVAMRDLATTLYELGDWKTALKICMLVKEIFEKEEQKKELAHTLHLIGVIYEGQGSYDDAIKLYQYSLRIYEELGDKFGVARILGQLGILHYYQGNYKEAIKLYQQSLKIKEELEDNAGISITLHNLGMIYGAQGDYDEAIKLYQQSLEIDKKLSDKGGISKTLHSLGNIYYLQKKYNEAIRLFQQSLKIKEELRDQDGMANTLGMLGMLHSSQNNDEEAIELFQRCLKVEEELLDKRGIANTLHNLGNIHLKRSNYEEAIKLYNQSLKMREELGDKSGIAQSLGQLGVIHEKKDKDYTSALEKYFTAFSIFKELNLNDSNKNIIESYIDKLKEKMSEEAFNKTLEEIRRRYGA